MALLAGWVGGLAAVDGATVAPGESAVVSAGDAEVSADAESAGLGSGLELVLGCGVIDDAGPLGLGLPDLHDFEATGFLDAVPRAD